jgi:hypothetical protein
MYFRQYCAAIRVNTYVAARMAQNGHVFDTDKLLFAIRGHAVMHTYLSASNSNVDYHTYLSAMDLGLPCNSNVDHQNLYLEVDYQVENSEVVVKSVRSCGGELTPVLSEGARLAIAQQIQDSLEFGY